MLIETVWLTPEQMDKISTEQFREVLLIHMAVDLVGLPLVYQSYLRILQHNILGAWSYTKILEDLLKRGMS